MRCVLCLQPKVEFTLEGVFELWEQPLVAIVRKEPPNERPNQPQRAQVGGDLVSQLRVLHLDCDSLAAECRRPVHLRKRGRRHRLALDAAEELLGRCPCEQASRCLSWRAHERLERPVGKTTGLSSSAVDDRGLKCLSELSLSFLCTFSELLATCSTSS